MGVPDSHRFSQIQCYEGDSEGEQKVKIVQRLEPDNSTSFRKPSANRLQAQGVHFRLFVDVILPRVP